MQHDLFRSGHDMLDILDILRVRDPRSNFQNDLLMSNYRSIDGPQNEKYDAGKMIAVSLLSQKLSQKNLFCKKVDF